MIIKTLETIADLRGQVAEWRNNNETIALVPTMGALHEAHLALVHKAQKLADRVVVSIFVNPTQFGPNEDFNQYPRLLDADIARLEEVGVDAAYTPDVKEMYPHTSRTHIQVSGLNSILCGEQRPGHFDGVALVVTKLFMQCLPDVAIFGEKDYQQLLVIRQLTRDLNIPVKVQSLPTIREEDGLAKSSRNRYLSERERKNAPQLYRTLQKLARELPHSANINPLLEEAKSALVKNGFQKVEYLMLCDVETLQPLDSYRSPARLLVAARIGKTRLIDNIEV